MKKRFKIKDIYIIKISYASALLFIYATSSKLLEFDNFKIQLGQSPLIGAFAKYLIYIIPLIEVIIALLLLIPQYRSRGLKAAYMLMLLFTIYIYFILHYSAYIPCSCGGVLENMNWQEHFIFNLIFLILIAVAILFMELNNKINNGYFIKNIKNCSLWLLCSTVIGFLIMISLFKWSDQIVHYGNTTIRKMPPHGAQLEKSVDLKLNSYYFAGNFEGKIYLGNSTAPFIITEIDTTLNSIKTHKVIPDNKDIPFYAPAIRIHNNTFFLFEGDIPYIFRGSIKDWNAKLIISGGMKFSHLEPIDSSKVAVRFIAPKSGKSILGTIDLGSKKEMMSNKLLQQQMDGIFDVDGSLHVDYARKKIVYVYRYRNQFIVANSNLTLDFRGNTIDTIQSANIDLAFVKSKNIKTFSSTPLLVNKMSAIENSFLYVNSNIPGEYDSDRLWKEASIIDIYNLTKNSYHASFPIYKIGSSKMNSFIVVDNKVFVLIGNNLVSYRIYEHLLNKSEVNK